LIDPADLILQFAGGMIGAVLTEITDDAIASCQQIHSLKPPLRWWRIFPGEAVQLRLLRRWIAAFLPEGPARDDVASVATELASNAVRHTASGVDGYFAVEICCRDDVIRVAVADSGAPTGPRLVPETGGENGRGLVLVRALAIRTGVAGDYRSRLVWADLSWPG
jgi:signal transduction histidine kinase